MLKTLQIVLDVSQQHFTKTTVVKKTKENHHHPKTIKNQKMKEKKEKQKKEKEWRKETIRKTYNKNNQKQQIKKKRKEQCSIISIYHSCKTNESEWNEMRCKQLKTQIY